MDWLSHLKSQYFKKPGQHAIIVGPTGVGKTQVIYWNIDGFVNNSRDTIAYFDIHKSGEILRLADFRDLKIFLPIGKKLDIYFEKGKGSYADKIEYDYFDIEAKENPYEGVFENFEREKINVVCIKPFIRDTDKYAMEISRYSKTLINMALDHRLKHIRPATHTFDEFHWVAPGQGHALNEEHNKAGIEMQMNIDTLRSEKQRILAASQAWTKIRRGVRTAFMFIFVKRGCNFTKTDEPRLSKYNDKWGQMAQDEVVVVFPRRNFTDFMKLPFYGDGEDIGEVHYISSSSFLPSPNLGAITESMK
jgi:hypothetical protein